MSIILVFNCGSIEPVLEKNILIQEKDVAVHNAYIHISFSNDKNKDVNLYRNNEIVTTFDYNSIDTIICDTLLKPDTHYEYKLSIDLGMKIYESNILGTTTLKTTNHNCHWETYTFDSPVGMLVSSRIYLYKFKVILLEGKGEVFEKVSKLLLK